MSIIRKSDKNDRKKKNFSVGIALLILFVIAVLTYAIFEKSGHWLVQNDEVDHVKWVAVLDGQTADLERSDYAANLVKEGKADSVLLLGRRVYRERSNSEFYAEDFMKLGAFDSNAVFLVPHNDPSTISEAYSIIPWLKKHNIDTVLLLTDAASTYRVKRIFQKLSGNSPVYVTKDIHHVTYNPNCWYSNRESRKTWLRGWAALFASYLDLFNTDTLEAVDSSYYKPIKSYAEYKREFRSNVNLQKLLPKIEDKIRTESEKETVKDSVKTSVTESSKTQEKAPEKAQAKETPKATAKETPKDKAAEKKTDAKAPNKTPAKQGKK
ncbi:ElyC/SanA/YdcF family protein [uncultured Fibrobacter sp.]|uniref:YdcF family protein n=1 Tax=uncultured Fibrobacter sp. TaxID=261512 RepID=UPI0025D6427A|nr:ElyC/SanA/YdcF family protein [uncultured Fibrobacter sp.]